MTKQPRRHAGIDYWQRAALGDLRRIREIQEDQAFKRFAQGLTFLKAGGIAPPAGLRDFE